MILNLNSNMFILCLIVVPLQGAVFKCNPDIHFTPTTGLIKQKEVGVNIILHQIESFNDQNQELQIQITMQLSWVDIDLLKYLHSAPSSVSNTHLPYIFIENEKSRQQMSSIASDIRGHLQIINESISYRMRSSILLACPLDMKFFPFDRVSCSIIVATYLDDVHMTWSTPTALIVSENLKQLSILSYVKFMIRERKYITTVNGNMSTINMDLILEREYHYYISAFYIPVLILVLISWIPLWLKRVIILRIYIASSTLMFLSWYYVSRPVAAETAYLTSLDAWRSINFIFVSLAALENVFITYMIKTNKTRLKRVHPDENDKFKMLTCEYCPLKKKYLEVDDKNVDIDLEILKLKANYKVQFVNVAKEVEIIDNVSKLFFPSAYSIFLFFYSFKCYVNLYL